MTLAEAREFIEEAERLPPNEVDVDKLQEAIRVIDEASKLDLSGLVAQLDRVGALVGKGFTGLDQLATGLTGALDELMGRLSTQTDDGEEDAESVASVFTRSAGRESLLAHRARALAVNVIDRSAQGEDDRVAGPGRTERTPPGRLTPERGSASPTMRSAIHSRSPAVPASLVNRMMTAGAAVGLSPNEIRSVIADAEAQAAEAQAFIAQGVPGVEPVSVEQMLEDTVIEWMSAAQPIGVPADFVANVAEDVAPATEGLERFRQRTGRPTPTRQREVMPRYFESDEWNLAGLAPEELITWQRRLVDAGLMEPDTYYPGVWTDIEAGALRAAMGIANASGRDLDTTLNSLIANLPEDVKERRRLEQMAKVFQAPPFVKPDPASLAQGAKAEMRRRLGREPNPDEMAEVTAHMSGLYRQGYEAEVAAMRADFDANVALEETGVAQAPATVADVDEEARFREFFDKRFGPEMEFIEGQRETIRSRANVFESLSTMGNLIR